MTPETRSAAHLFSGPESTGQCWCIVPTLEQFVNMNRAAHLHTLFDRSLSRRELISMSALAGMTAAMGEHMDPHTQALIERSIPSSGHRIAAVGLGTWQTFDVGSSASERAPLAAFHRRAALRLRNRGSARRLAMSLSASSFDNPNRDPSEV